MFDREAKARGRLSDFFMKLSMFFEPDYDPIPEELQVIGENVFPIGSGNHPSRR